MSYILDALKKSEKERRQTSVPDLKTVQETVPYQPKRHARWPYIILVVLMLNIAIMGWWLGTWHSKITKPDSQSAVVSKKVEPSPETAKTDNMIAETVEENDVTNRSQGIQSNRKAKAQDNIDRRESDEITKKADIKEEQKSLPQAPQHTSQTDHIQSETQPEQKIPLPIPNKIYTQGELPQVINQALPSFTISAFLYSDDPNSRMVRVNGTMLKEGDYLADGLRLDEIKPNELIFSYHQFRFLIGLK